MTCAPCAAASRAASSCLSVIDSWSPDQSVWSNAALTIVMAFLLGDGPASAGATFQGCAGPMVPTAREGRDPCSTDRVHRSASPPRLAPFFVVVAAGTARLLERVRLGTIPYRGVIVLASACGVGGLFEGVGFGYRRVTRDVVS